MKKMVVALTSVALLMGYASNGEAEINQKNAVKVNATNQSKLMSFSDVSPSYWAYKEITYLLENDIAEALSGTNFAPEDNITRGHAARMLAKALKLDIHDPKYKDVDFPDVPKTHPDYGYIKAVVNENIFKGQDDGNFGVNNPLTRAQMAKILTETFDLQVKGQHPFPDVSDTHWADAYIDALYSNGITTGSNGKYLPNNFVKRSQLAVFLYRALMLESGKESGRMTLDEIAEKNSDLFATTTNIRDDLDETAPLTAKMIREGLDYVRETRLKIYGDSISNEVSWAFSLNSDNYTYPKGISEFLFFDKFDKSEGYKGEFVIEFDFRSDDALYLAKKWTVLANPELEPLLPIIEEKTLKGRELEKVNDPEGTSEWIRFKGYDIFLGVQPFYETMTIDVNRSQ